MTSHIWQRVNTGESYIFYFGIFICCATLTRENGTFHVRLSYNIDSDMSLGMDTFHIEVIPTTEPIQY